MNIRFCLLATALFYIFTTPSFAHPGPHSHLGVPEASWHAFIGWEVALAVLVIGALGFIFRRLRNPG